MGVDTIKKKQISDLMELVVLLYKSTDFSGLFGFRWVLTYSGFSAQEFMTLYKQHSSKLTAELAAAHSRWGNQCKPVLKFGLMIILQPWDCLSDNVIALLNFHTNELKIYTCKLLYR